MGDMGKAYLPPITNRTFHHHVTVRALDQFRERAEEEFKHRGEVDLARLLDERVEGAIKAGDVTVVKDIKNPAEDTRIVKIEDRGGVPYFAVLRPHRIYNAVKAKTVGGPEKNGFAIVGLLTKHMADHNYLTKQWIPSISRPFEKLASLKIEVAPPAPRPAPIVEYAPPLRERALAATSAAFPPPPVIPLPRRPDAAEFPPPLAIVPPSSGRSALRDSDTLPELLVPLAERAAPAPPTARRYYKIASDWTREHGDALVRIVEEGERDIVAVQRKFAEATGTWRTAGSIMLRMRPLDHVDGAHVVARGGQKHGRIVAKLCDAQERHEAALHLTGNHAALPEYITLPTVILLVMSTGRIAHVGAYVDSENDATVYPRDEVLEVHRRVLKTFGRVHKDDAARRLSVEYDEEATMRYVVAQVLASPGIASTKIRGADRHRIVPALERAQAAGLIVVVKNRNGFVCGPPGWTLPPPAPRLPVEAPAPPPSHAERVAAAIDGAVAAGMIRDPRPVADPAIDEVYRALRAGELSAADAMELIKALRAGGGR